MIIGISPITTYTYSKTTTITDSSFNLSDFADFAQVIIAIINILLAAYIFVHQIQYNREAELKLEKSNLQSIKLQWFKELIIQPKIHNLDAFVGGLKNIHQLVQSSSLSENDILIINQDIKSKAYDFKINFYEVVRNVNQGIYIKLRTESEKVVDKLTTTFSDNNFDFTNKQIFEKEVLDHIKLCHDNIIAIILNYKGE